MTVSERRAVTVETLTEERDFLLRSLADLEAERRAGELSDARFQELHDQYTVQAATVLRALDRLGHESPDAVPSASPSRGRDRRGRRAAAALAVVAVVGVAVALLTGSIGDRGPGQSITGNAQSAAPDVDALGRAARARPGDPSAQKAYAFALLEADRPVDALRTFDAAARLDPGDPVPKAYGGWIIYLAGLVDEGLTRLDAAVAADPDYPDARFFRAMALWRGRDDRARAADEFRAFVRLLPDGPERTQVQGLLAELEGAGPPSPTTVPG